MPPAPAYYCPVCNVQLDADKVIGPNLDGTTPPHDPPGADPLVPFVFCEGTGTPPVVCDHVDACPASCPGALDACRWATFHGTHERRTAHRGLVLVVRLPPSFPSWAAYQDVACRVFVDGGQAAGIRDAERRAVAVIDEAFRTTAPPCLTGMGCLCAGHARGDAPQARCDTSEAPGGRPETPADTSRQRRPGKLDDAEKRIIRGLGARPARTLQCAMDDGCTAAVTHIDEKGFVYCTPHGDKRKGHCRCRKLRPYERRKLERNEPIARY